MSVAAAQRSFWARTRRLTMALAAIWLVATLGVPWFATELNTVSLFGFPLGWWMAAEGTLFVYLVIIIVYAWCMDRLERRYLEAAADEAPP